MQHDIGLYEKKVINDKEFPINILVNLRGGLKHREVVFEPHWHEHLELHYVMSGEMEVSLNQESYTVAEGALAVANSNVIHAGYCDSSLKALVVIFDMMDLTKELADQNIVFQEVISSDPVIREYMNDIYREYTDKEIGYSLICKAKVLQLITYMTRNYAKAMLSDRDSLKRMKRLQRLNTVYEYIEDHCTEPIHNRELAEVLHLSEDRFNHLFKECVGVSPIQYINEVRLNKALSLLKTGEFSSAQVAEAVGFTDYNYFGRLFRRSFGCTPSQVLRENRADDNIAENKEDL